MSKCHAGTRLTAPAPAGTASVAPSAVRISAGRMRSSAAPSWSGSISASRSAPLARFSHARPILTATPRLLWPVHIASK
jgi:hypothetical protein